MLLTIPLISGLLLAIANSVSQESIFSADEHLAKVVFVFLAVVLSAACAAMLLSYFTCMVAASALAQLDGHSAPLLGGLKLFGQKFRYITKFAAVSIAFIPIGFVAQRRKLKGSRIKKVEVIGSSITLSTATLAPEILSQDKKITDTIYDSVETLGKGWREGLVIKVAIYAAIIFMTLLTGFLPRLVQSYWFDSTTSQAVAQLVTILLFIGLLITGKVLGTVFTTVLYWQIVTEHDQEQKVI